MAHQNDFRRTIAKRYLELARTSEDIRERERFLGFAAIYERLADQSNGEEISVPRGKEQRHERDDG